MPATPFDSTITGGLFGDAELAGLFTDSAEIRAMLLVEGTLAKVQGALGIIPETSGRFLHRASIETPLDAALLTQGTTETGVPVPALVTAFRDALKAPEHAKYLHWGATSQDIADTGLVLRLRRVIEIFDTRLVALTATLADKARLNRDIPMAARTRSQIATPTTFGARIAVWASPLPRHRARLAELRPRLLQVSLAGASGTLAALEGRGREVAEGLGRELDLGVPDLPWHAARDSVVELGQIAALIAGSLAKLGTDLIAMTQSETGEVSIGAGGGSSTMPHKSNPVGAEALVTIGRLTAGLSGTLAGALPHAQERDGAAWALEWASLPQILIATAAALAHAQRLAESLEAQPEAMRRNIEATNGLIFAEAASFALAATMPRPEAQALVKEACREAAASGHDLRAVLESRTAPGIDWDTVFDPLAQSGEARALVDRFLASLA